MQLYTEAVRPHISQVFPVDFQDRLERSLDVVRVLRVRGVKVVRTDPAAADRPVIEINPAHAEKLNGLGHGHRMAREADMVVTHGLLVNGCEVRWYAGTVPLQQRQRA